MVYDNAIALVTEFSLSELDMEFWMPNEEVWLYAEAVICGKGSAQIVVNDRVVSNWMTTSSVWVPMNIEVMLREPQDTKMVCKLKIDGTYSLRPFTPTFRAMLHRDPPTMLGGF